MHGTTDSAPHHPRPDFRVRQDRAGRVRARRSPATASSSSRPAAPRKALTRRRPRGARTSSELTGFPEMMDGRVKTLHPEGAWRPAGDPRQRRARRRRWRAHGIAPIDLLVVNLYPFEATVAKGADFDDCIENIDIGGPAMIRAAAKNHADVAVVVEPDDYARVLAELAQHGGATTLALRKKLAAKAYARTARLRRGDLQLVRRRARRSGARRTAPSAASSPRRCATARTRTRARRSTARREQRPGVATARQVQGKQLSYNNINDTDAAYECVAEFDPARTAACAIIKHANPCGVAEGDSLRRGLPQGAAPAIRRRRSAASSRSTARSTPRPRAPSPRSSPR